jgi:hypothetical protein
VKPRGRAVPPPRPTDEAQARAAAIQAALAQNDAAPTRAWAKVWLPDTSTIDAADDASLLESARAAAAVVQDPAAPTGLAGIDAAAVTVARQLAALPTGARERFLAALEASPRADALTRDLNRLIAAQARRLLNTPKVNTP